MKIASLVLTTLSLFLGMFFFFFGYIKLSPSLNKEIHREIRRSFVKYAKVVPVFKQLGWKVSPAIYRQVIGYIEIGAGLSLAFMPDIIKFYVSLFLICLTLGAVYTHVKIEDEIDKMYPALAFTAMLICRIILYCLLRRHRRHELQLKAKQTELAELQEQVAKAQLAVDVTGSGETEPKAVGKKTDANEDSNSKPGKKARRRSKKQKEN